MATINNNILSLTRCLRIMDAGYSSEVVNMTKAQILQQAGTIMLAQANQVPQTVLALLGKQAFNWLENFAGITSE